MRYVLERKFEGVFGVYLFFSNTKKRNNMTLRRGKKTDFRSSRIVMDTGAGQVVELSEWTSLYNLGKIMVM